MTGKTKWLVALGGALALIVVIGFTISRARWQLSEYEARLRAQGGTLKMRDYIPPPVAPDENAAPSLALLADQIRPSSLASDEFVSGMRLVAPGRARVAWREPRPFDVLSRKTPPTNSTWEVVQAELHSQSDLLAEIRQTLARPHLNCNLDYSRGFGLLLPHLAKHKMLAQFLARAVTLDLHAGDLSAALADLRALLSLARLQSEEPIVISQLVQMAIAQIASGPTWEALHAPGWQDAQLAQLQQDWQQSGFIPPMRLAVDMERAMTVEFFEQARHSVRTFQQLDHYAPSGGAAGAAGGSSGTLGDLGVLLDRAGDWLGSSPERTGVVLKALLWQSYWSYQDERHYLEVMEHLRQALKEAQDGSPVAPLTKKLAAACDRVFGDKTDPSSGRVSKSMGYLFTFQLTPSLQGMLTKTARAEVVRRLAVTAIALERYRLLHGKAAPDLAALTPQLLPAVLLDPMDGQPLRYRTNEDGTFLLYSVGEDGSDDGGNAHPIEANPRQFSVLSGKDWVWPQVASAAEIAAAEAKAKK
jgi:hypothetical protein